MTAGETLYSYFKPKTIIHALSAGEAGSGVFSVTVNNENPLVNSGVVYAQVKDPTDGTLRTLTKSFYDPSTGIATITGTYTAGDVADVLLIKYT